MGFAHGAKRCVALPETHLHVQFSAGLALGIAAYPDNFGHPRNLDAAKSFGLQYCFPILLERFLVVFNCQEIDSSRRMYKLFHQVGLFGNLPRPRHAHAPMSSCLRCVACVCHCSEASPRPSVFTWPAKASLPGAQTLAPALEPVGPHSFELTRLWGEKPGAPRNQNFGRTNRTNRALIHGNDSLSSAGRNQI